MDIKEGDIFRWHYKDEQPDDRRQYSRYHCMSQIAIAKNGRLVDTYWGVGAGAVRAAWDYADAERRLVLTPLGNLADLENQPEHNANYYDDADCVDINHANSSKGNFYVRKGAQRSRAKMLAVLEERVAKSERDIANAKVRLERDQQMMASITNGASLDAIYL